jgi:ArsR family transcriptional regulator, arsenate/arsenite/antimonite-responsive transcriptional repressor
MLKEITLKQIVDIFKALSNEHRLAIFLRLSCCYEQAPAEGDNGQVCECVGALGEDLGIAQSTVSHHLKELSRCGLIKMERRGQNVECRVDPEVIQALIKFLESPNGC